MLKIEYSLLSLLTVGTLLGVTYTNRLESPLLFLTAEVVSVIVVLWLIRLYLYVSKPLKELNNALRLLTNNDFQSRLLPTPHPIVNKLVTVFNKMIDRIHQERVEQREQSYFLEHLIKATPLGIIILDYDQKIIKSNPTALNMLEMDFNTIQSKTLNELNAPLLDAIHQLPLETAQDIQFSGGRKYRCHKSSFIFQGFQQQFIIIQDLYLEDIKKEKQAYSKVIRMMSHEVNNSVGAINSFVDTLKMFAPTDDELKEDYIDALSIIKDRNGAMALFMKNFASVVKVPEPDFQNIDLKLLLENLTDLYKADFTKHQIDVELNIEQEVIISADKSLLEQLFINILKNAKEALMEVNDKKVIQIGYHQSNKKLEIWNSGPTISKEVEEKLFTPFYSSKPTGQGIGLMLCRDILIKHGWDFGLFSDERGGATFVINLRK
ncbi:PAS domain-containing sensor histidine kinase [Flammeovirga sp. EKP202]|uniref:sensor histidine kinase n=1 Tax=Flammeovirga sp. EKP202 TaxID=2770592 RepID=UPI00165F33FD|nr:ATP-binding protein [Flammeovirga sp. EKP202]MBD0402650.1 GHKL domain-containing protein [Flammeovirga sp. EKP202]